MPTRECSHGVDAAWLCKYADIVTEYKARGYTIEVGSTIGLASPAGSLAFGVIIFSVCACVCIGTLALRRKYLDAELGSKEGAGKAQAAAAAE